MTVQSLLYAYAIAAIPHDSDSLGPVLRDVAGIDASRLELVAGDASSGAAGIVALVSHVDASAYDAREVESRVGELEWLAPRAEAHDRVVTAAADRAEIIPLPIFSLFRDEAAVRASLANRRETLRNVFARLRGAREYTIRIYRNDALVSAALGHLSARIRELEKSAAEATPGQRYLLQRKLDEERRTELRRVSAEVAQATFDALAPLARESVREPLPAPAVGADAKGSPGTQQAILNASFLVDDRHLDNFRRELSRVMTVHEGAGFRFDFTGPWPAYHFVRELGASAHHD